ncbi:hypothetical protein RJ641_018693 [Dillenia turbinata]|uniref:Uncharacterized protein n=1 Tax=Dillenia turbinata TaxID=194707 RepID=A0AAN8USD5_9MAGN
MQLTSAKTLNGINFEDWKESLDLYLTITNMDLTLREEKPPALTSQSTTVMKQSIPETNNAVTFLKSVGEKFKTFDKGQKGHFLSLLEKTKYDGVSGVHEHMMNLVHYYNKLKSLKVELDEWTIDEMIAIVTQEEESMKKGRPHSAQVVASSSDLDSYAIHDLLKQADFEQVFSFSFFDSESTPETLECTRTGCRVEEPTSSYILEEGKMVSMVRCGVASGYNRGRPIVGLYENLTRFDLESDRGTRVGSQLCGVDGKDLDSYAIHDLLKVIKLVSKGPMSYNDQISNLPQYVDMHKEVLAHTSKQTLNKSSPSASSTQIDSRNP